MPESSHTQTRRNQHGDYPQAVSVEDFRRNLAAVRARMDAACHRAGRDPTGVRLLPVSKTKPEPSLRLAYAAGCRVLGENKVQEAFGKWDAMQDLADLHWSVIGHLQTNKARLVARFASEFQALDSLRVAEAPLQRLGRGQQVRAAARGRASLPERAACFPRAARARVDDARVVFFRE